MFTPNHHAANKDALFRLFGKLAKRIELPEVEWDNCVASAVPGAEVWADRDYTHTPDRNRRIEGPAFFGRTMPSGEVYFYLVNHVEKLPRASRDFGSIKWEAIRDEAHHVFRLSGTNRVRVIR